MTCTLYINNEKFTIDNPSPDLSLNEFIRYHTRFTGTKRNCAEGGCGVCGVALTWNTPTGPITRAINSCLRPVAACNGMHITTIDGIGSAKEGYNPIQAALASHNGTQCGYCSPGMVMSMYGLLQNNASPNSAEVERAFDGNICRCTGYRPILAAMKTFASDHSAQEELRQQTPVPKHLHDDMTPVPQGGVQDIEKHKAAVSSLLEAPSVPPRQIQPQSYVSEGKVWVDCPTMEFLTQMIQKYQWNDIYFVAGHTGWGVEKYYPHPNDLVYLNIGMIPDLHKRTISSTGISIGAALPIADAMKHIASSLNPLPHSFQVLNMHLERVAHTMVRNVGTLGGNLMLAHRHQTYNNSFPSDVCTVLFGIGATVDVMDMGGQMSSDLPIEAFLALDMKNQVLMKINVPFPMQNETFRSYKTAIRHVNSHAYVPSAMRAMVDPASHHVLARPVLVFGGIRDKIVRMTQTENAMIGIDVTDESAFHSLCETLTDELQPTIMDKLEYRKTLALSYFYKFFLSLQPQSALTSNLVTAQTPWMTRMPSQGTQNYQKHPEEAPVGQYMVKVAAKQQTSGEALYVDDLPAGSTCLHAAFVKSTQANAEVKHIDASAALVMPGVKRFLSTGDIDPTHNMWFAQNTNFADPAKGHTEVRPLFATKVDFYGQVIGMIVADTAAHASAAAKQVVVHYDNIQPGIYELDDAVAKKSFWPDDIAKGVGYPVVTGDSATAISGAPHKVTGTVEVGRQYHFYMEPQSAMAVPEENQSIKIYAATQYQTFVQLMVSKVLGIPASDVIIETRRCGGGYGGKIANSALVTVGASYAAWKMGVPVKMVFEIQDNMEALGVRHPFRADYTIGFDDDGKLLGVDVTQFTNTGAGFADSSFVVAALLQNTDGVYSCENWTINGKLCKTNLPPNTSTRGPGWVPATFMIEHMLTSVARYLGKTPEAVKQANFYKKGAVTPVKDIVKYFNIPTIWDQIMKTANFANRQNAITQYNSENKWRKKGISIVPVKFAVGWGTEFSALIDVYADGSVSVVQGGIEIGQGIHTKLVQIVAKVLGCDMSLVKINPPTTLVSNKLIEVTGGSITSELCGVACTNAANEINGQLAPVKKLLKSKLGGAEPQWGQVVGMAAGMGLKLSATGRTTKPAKPDCGSQNYNSYSAAVAEVEVDILTGETEINQVDILFDCGISMNPAIDIGQIEGAFLMGVGYYLNEEMRQDAKTGKLLNLGTWEYKPPSAFDIPIQWNVNMLANSPTQVDNFMGSKVVGEPPMCCSSAVMFAIENAVAASLKERSAAADKQYYSLNCPATVDKIANLSNLHYTAFNLK